MNAGPRHRFTVLGASGPMLVHNCENVTQAVAGSIIRETLVYLEGFKHTELIQTVGHTHDEIVLEVADKPAVVAHARTHLHAAMLRRSAWRETLPLAVEVEDNWWYTKSVPHH